MADNNPEVSRRHFLKILGALGVTAAGSAAVGSVWKFLEGQRQEGIPSATKTPNPTNTPIPSPTSETTATTTQEPSSTAKPKETSTPEPTKVPAATAETVKPLPDVINNQTARFISLDDEETQTSANKTKTIPLPEIVSEHGYGLQVVHSIDGLSGLAITSNYEIDDVTIKLPVLLKGKVKKVLVGEVANASSIAFQLNDGRVWAYGVPSPASSSLQEGKDAGIGQTAISFKYDKTTLGGRNFQNYLKYQFIDAPPNTIAFIASTNNTKGLDKTGILNTPQGIVIVPNR